MLFKSCNKNYSNLAKNSSFFLDHQKKKKNKLANQNYGDNTRIGEEEEVGVAKEVMLSREAVRN